MMMAGQSTPHFLFGLAEKKTGRGRSKRKERRAQTCTCVQVCLNTGVFCIVADKDKKSSAGRGILRQFRSSAPAAAGPAETSGRSRIPCPPVPAAAPPALPGPPERGGHGPGSEASRAPVGPHAPATAMVAAARLEVGGIRALPGPEDSPRASRFLCTEGR